MCILFLRYNEDPESEIRFIVAANRDEFFERPADSAPFWLDSKIFGAKDLSAGGTWLAINAGKSETEGKKVRLKFGLLTNKSLLLSHDEKKRKKPSEELSSRGSILVDFLTSHNEAAFEEDLINSQENYSGFNLITATNQGVKFYHDTSDEFENLPSGYYSLSNGSLNCEWRKCVDGKKLFEDVIETSADENQMLERLIFEVLSNDRTYSKEEEPIYTAPSTLTSIFVNPTASSKFGSRSYGTRYQAAFLVKRNGEILYKEKFYDVNRKAWSSIISHKLYSSMNSKE